ncbi:hypothetical protein PMAYCL1PPCAC_16498 [Pristionchus mayeri]|uniref:Phosphatase n=1 Tax=Pristionchus mayeri TaxID=1317129 RepID=A0AAN5HZB2_9BILA|nr:hypothetical protein PMAYCL1PPCAC_16498 [Pristionchus mayeri]
MNLLPSLLLLLLPLAQCELLFVAVIWRHGLRAPSRLPYPLDPHNETAWQRGWKELTNEGIKQMYDLGLWLHNRYTVENTLINSVFNKKEVLVLSTDVERALCSAQSVMASLFAPEGEFVWKRGFAWQPVPIHSYGEDRTDPLLKPTDFPCPAYDKLMTADTHPLQSVAESNDQLFKELTKNTGMEVNIKNVDDFYDITREMAHGLKQPDWVTDGLVDKIKEFKRIVRTNEFNSPVKARFRGGYLVGDWHSRINAAANGEKKAKKAVLYSSHDGTLSALLYTLGVANDQLVPHAAAIIAELHREAGKDFVKLWYRNETSAPTSDPVQLTLPGCETSCHLATFNAIVAPLTLNTTKQLEELCSSGSPFLSSLFLAFILLYVAISR